MEDIQVQIAIIMLAVASPFAGMVLLALFDRLSGVNPGPARQVSAN